MREKLLGYSLLSLFSFFAFSALFITAANAQISSTQISAPSPEISLEPTPTLFMAPTDTPTPAIAEPTPTLYIAPTDTPTPFPTVAPTNPPLPSPTPTNPPVPQPAAAITDLETLFTMYSSFYHVDADELKKIARCESGFNPNSANGDYIGMYQFAAQTWMSHRSAMGLDTNPDLRRSAEEAIRTAAYMLSLGQQNAWPNCK